MIEPFEQYAIDSRMCFFVTEVFRYSLLASVHILIAIGTVS